MFLIRLVLRNAFRHRLRALLTMLGLVVAVLAFGLLSTVVDAWYAGAEGASSARLVVRNSVSLVFPLPLSYKSRIAGIKGVQEVSLANWFGGVYIDRKHFFPQLAVDPESYLNLYAEYLLSDSERHAFLRDRRGCIVGAKLAATHGFKLGDNLSLKGTQFPGKWDFVVRGIYRGKDAKTDTGQMFFHWHYLNERLKAVAPRRADQAGLYIARIADPGEAAAVSQAIDAAFRNSRAETLTETEKAFQLGFVAMTEAIVIAIRVVSYLVIFIILAVMANTVVMTVRERTAEYATLKALGFGSAFIIALITGEAMVLALGGGSLGIALTFPVAAEFGSKLGNLFPVFEVSHTTVAMQALCAALVGLISALLPIRRIMRLRIVDGLRSIA